MLRTLLSAHSALFAVACACLLVSGCAKKKKLAPVALTPRIGSSETGVASWYGPPYHGRRAADGEIYDMEQLVAAHRTLPFNTWVEVLNLDNRKDVRVRIIDRGPFVDGRIIDLSKAAAREIEMLGPGTAQVRVTVVAPPTDAPRSGTFAVQVGAFQDRTRADDVRRRLAAEFGTAQLVPRSGDPPIWRVLVGSEPDLESANALCGRIRNAGHASFVVRLDDPPPPSKFE